jgi:endonuclease YncB( thermonuclease family)
MTPITYENCRVEKIIDGDTCEVSVELGFDIKILATIRLTGIDAAETYTVEGQVSKSQLSALCLGAEVKLICYGKERCGRYFGALIRKTDDLDINDEMIRLGCSDKSKY